MLHLIVGSLLGLAGGAIVGKLHSKGATLEKAEKILQDHRDLTEVIKERDKIKVKHLHQHIPHLDALDAKLALLEESNAKLSDVKEGEVLTPEHDEELKNLFASKVEEKEIEKYSSIKIERTVYGLDNCFEFCVNILYVNANMKYIFTASPDDEAGLVKSVKGSIVHLNNGEKILKQEMEIFIDLIMSLNINEPWYKFLGGKLEFNEILAQAKNNYLGFEAIALILKEKGFKEYIEQQQDYSDYAKDWPKED